MNTLPDDKIVRRLISEELDVQRRNLATAKADFAAAQEEEIDAADAYYLVRNDATRARADAALQQLARTSNRLAKVYSDVAWLSRRLLQLDAKEAGA